MSNELTPTTTSRSRRGRRSGLRWCTTTLLALILGAGLSLVGPAGIAGATQIGDVSLASHTSSSPTTAANQQSTALATSADGKYVVFTSSATNLVPGQTDTNNADDLFLLERATGKVTLVSHAAGSATTTANGKSSEPSITETGGLVAFTSEATNLVTGQSDTNGKSDVFLFARSTGTVKLVSHTPGTTTVTGNGASSGGVIGGFQGDVAFVSEATNLVTGQFDANLKKDVFRFRSGTGAIELISRVPGSTKNTANGYSYQPSISANGEKVVFVSDATNLTYGNDTNSAPDVYLSDPYVVSKVSAVWGTNNAGNGASGWASISANGMHVVFASLATNLVPGQTDGNLKRDVFRVDYSQGTNALVSHTPAGATTAANDDSYPTGVSDDGSYVGFVSASTNLVSGQVDVAGTPDAFLYERASGTVTLVSRKSTGGPGAAAGGVEGVSVSGDGGYVAYATTANTVVPGQTEGTTGDSDVFLFERAIGLTSLVSHKAGSYTTTGNYASQTPVISRDGRAVAFTSAATNLVTAQSDVNGATDAFVYQRPDPAIRIGDVKIAEGGEGTRTAYVPVTLSKPASGPVSVEYVTQDGTATEPADYTVTFGTLSFPVGALIAQVEVPIKGDFQDEPNHTFTVVLSKATGASIADGTGVVTILDDDPSAAGPRLAVSDVTLDEGDTGERTARVTVSLSQAAASTVTVKYTTANATATVADSDYTTKSGTVTFAAGQTSQSVDIVVKGDIKVEGNETFKVTLSGATGGATIADTTGIVTIRNDD